MKTLKLFFVCLLVLSFAAMAIAKPAVGMGKAPGKGKVAAATEITLTGINDPNLTDDHPNLPGVMCTPDVAQLQDAVDTYDTVYVQGIFDMGSWDKLTGPEVSGTVFITKDVTILSASSATFKGGYRSFTVGLPARRWVYDFDGDETFGDFTDATPVKAVFRNLSIERHMLFFIFVVATNGLEVSGCQFFDAKPIPWVAFGGQPVGKAIHVGPASLIGGTLPGKITGDIVIKDNIIDGNVKKYTFPTDGAVGPFMGFYWDGMNSGMSFFGTLNLFGGPEDYAPIETANVTISGNQISNITNNGLAVSATFGNVSIDHNTIKPGPNNFGGQGLFFREDGYFGEGDPEKTTTVVSYNTIIQENSSDDALWCDGATDAEISNNDITANNNFCGIGIYDNCFSCTVSGNTIGGTATAGCLVWGNAVSGNIETEARDNIFENNDMSNFTPADRLGVGLGAHELFLVQAFDNTSTLNKYSHVAKSGIANVLFFYGTSGNQLIDPVYDNLPANSLKVIDYGTNNITPDQLGNSKWYRELPPGIDKQQAEDALNQKNEARKKLMEYTGN